MFCISNVASVLLEAIFECLKFSESRRFLSETEGVVVLKVGANPLMMGSTSFGVESIMTTAVIAAIPFIHNI